MALEYIDICLGEALERLDEAGGELVKYKKEFDKNPQRYEELSEISQTAQRLEKDGKFKEASEIYEKLLEVSDLSHFVLVAQAGLYRCKK